MSESSEIEVPAPADSFWEVAQFKVKIILYTRVSQAEPGCIYGLL